MGEPEAVADMGTSETQLGAEREGMNARRHTV